MPVDSVVLDATVYRSIGPHRGGRVVAVAGDPSRRQVFYFGACTGGVWKTDDGGVYWQNVSDPYFKTSAVGAIAVSDADPNVIYAGTGEACIRGNVSHGDGVYKSTDGGKTWANVGLQDTRHIARIRIDPKDPNLVYVAALGHAFGPNSERGVFRSKDGGKNWEKVLYRSENAGAIDLSMDPNNPRILYATIWQTRRYPWTLESGGPESGIFKSSDGGDTWTDLSKKPGLPTGLMGRIGVAASPARTDRVWVVMDAQDISGGLFRSDDGGENWTRVSDDRNLFQRPWYYEHVFADPLDADTVYILNLQAWKSTDGGKSFTQITTPHGDNHDLWIDPKDPQRMIEGNDGGACVSFNGGETFSTIYNQPTAQFYHVDTDTQFPYRVYGTQQDNSAICAPSRTNLGAIPIGECYVVGHAESGYIAVRPDNSNIVFAGAVGSSPGGGGSLLKYDHSTRQTRIITVWPEVYGGWAPKGLKYRFQWTYPIVLSPHDPNVLYVTGNQVFRSTDEGQSWEVMSPDLTRNDPSKLEASGGPVTKDTTGAEHYCTIFAFAESPHQRGVFWAGSDDGLIHLSQDGGKSWQNVTPKELPEWATINMIEVSPHDPATAYVAATRYKLDDTHPYLYKTNDFGKTWQQITNGLPNDDHTRSIREDPVRRGLLFAGTETGLFVSTDDGANWQSMKGNLPAVPVYDMKIKDDDLVLATHGRSFWILDDLTLLRQAAEGSTSKDVHLFKPRRTYRVVSPGGFGRPGTPGKNYSMGLGSAATYYETVKPTGEAERTFLNAGKNPPEGVVANYFLKQKPQGQISLSFLDASGKEIRSFNSASDADTAGAGAQAVPGMEGREARQLTESTPEEPQEPRITADAGMNRFVWNMRHPDAVKVPGDVTTERSTLGPLVPPGAYQVRLTVGGQSFSQSFEIVKDLRVKASQADFEAQTNLWLQVRDKVSETHEAINQIRDIKHQVDEWVRRASAESPDQELVRLVVEAGKQLNEKLTAVEDELIQGKAKAGSDTLNLPSRLNAKLAAIPAVIASADGAPPKQCYEVFEHLSKLIDEQLQQFREIKQTDVAHFNRAVRDADLPAVIPQPPASARRGAAAGVSTE